MKATFADVLEAYDDLPGLIYFEPNEGPETHFIADSYEQRVVQEIADEELAFAIRDRLELLPQMHLEIERLRCSLKNLSHAVEHQWPAKSESSAFGVESCEGDPR